MKRGKVHIGRERSSAHYVPHGVSHSEDADFTISIFKDPDGANTLFWTGVLLHEQVELQDEAYPIQNTLTAVDDLGNLKNITYDNSGTFTQDRKP